jgi:hypothetical protein
VSSVTLPTGVRVIRADDGDAILTADLRPGFDGPVIGSVSWYLSPSDVQQLHAFMFPPTEQEP